MNSKIFKITFVVFVLLQFIMRAKPKHSGDTGYILGFLFAQFLFSIILAFFISWVLKNRNK
jgi:ABC-type polysaccharide/polyol phosphate export permease